MGEITVTALAKINLTLEVLGKRADGYHEIRSVLQAVDLCDILHFRPGSKTTFRCDMPGWSAEASLVTKAVSLLREVTGCTEGATVEIEKRIPLVSGLGGDSSDAAAVLRGLNKLWGLNLPLEKLTGLAAKLGSDVAFFLYGGTALAEGRGEKISPLPPMPPVLVILVVPDIPRLPGKTKKLYASLKPNHYTDGHITDRLIKGLEKGNEFDSAMIFNTFENVAFDLFPGLRVYREHFIILGAPIVHLAGSGPALFTILKDKKQAGELYASCKQQGMEAYMVATRDSCE